MTWETSLRQRLLDYPGVSAKVSTRVDWILRPQGSALPAITLQTISDPWPQNMGGLIDGRGSRLQIDIWGLSAKVVAELRGSVISALLPAADVSGTKFQRSFVNNVMDRGESTETGFMYRDMVDLTVWHN